MHKLIFDINSKIIVDGQELTAAEAEVKLLECSYKRLNSMNFADFEAIKFQFEHVDNDDDQQIEYFVYNKTRIYRVIVTEKFGRFEFEYACYQKQEIEVTQHIMAWSKDTYYRPYHRIEWWQVPYLPQEVKSWLKNYAKDEASSLLADKRLRD